MGNLKSRLKDVEIDTMMKSANIISLHETQFVKKILLPLK